MESQSLIGRRNFNKTRRAYEEWLKQEPDNAVAAFMLRALKGDAMPRAPNSVVTGLFDRQAATFEEHLAKLDYRVPYLVHQVLERKLKIQVSHCRFLMAAAVPGCAGPSSDPTPGD